jgi:hypothetical protein
VNLVASRNYRACTVGSGGAHVAATSRDAVARDSRQKRMSCRARAPSDLLLRTLMCAALLIAVGGEHWMRALGRVRKALCPPHPQWLAGQPLNMVYTMLGASTMVPVGLLMFWLAP